jgi:hypothetical protein
MSTLQGSGWNQIKRGLTTIEEVIRYADGFVGEENSEEVLSEGTLKNKFADGSI